MTKQQLETAVVRPSLTFLKNDIEYKLMDDEQENQLEVSVYDATEYIEKNSGIGKTESEKDELYKNAQKYWKILASTLQDTKFNFYLDQEGHKYLFDLLKNKLEYDSNTVFFAMELSDMLSQKATWNGDKNQQQSFQLTATEITYVYHLISKHKVKGLNKESYIFVEILRRIGQISKVINFYDAGAKSINARIQQWVAGFDPTPDFGDVQQEPVEKLTTA